MSHWLITWFLMVFLSVPMCIVAETHGFFSDHCKMKWQRVLVVMCLASGLAPVMFILVLLALAGGYLFNWIKEGE